MRKDVEMKLSRRNFYKYGGIVLTFFCLLAFLFVLLSFNPFSIVPWEISDEDSNYYISSFFNGAMPKSLVIISRHHEFGSVGFNPRLYYKVTIDKSEYEELCKRYNYKLDLVNEAKRLKPARYYEHEIDLRKIFKINPELLSGVISLATPNARDMFIEDPNSSKVVIYLIRPFFRNDR